MEKFAVRCDYLRHFVPKENRMKSQTLVKKRLLIIFTALLFALPSVSKAANQLVVFEEPATGSMVGGLTKVAADAFKSRLNQMNFLVFETNLISRKVGLNNFTPSRATVLASLPTIQSAYGDVLVIFLKSRLHLPENRNAFLQLSATVVSSATESQLLSSSIDGDGFLLPRECDANCTQILGTRAARGLAETLAMRIGKMLNAPSGAMGELGKPVNKVQFDLINFDEKKRTHLMDLLINEFPGFLSIVNTQQTGPQMRFSYYTEASNIKLQKWIAISLREIGVNPESEVDLLIKPGSIQIILTGTGKSRGSIGNPLKYN